MLRTQKVLFHCQNPISTPISEHDLGIEHPPNPTGEGSVLVDAMEKVVGRKGVSVSFTIDGKFIYTFVSMSEDYEDAMDKIICGNDTEFNYTNWYHDAMDEIIHPKESAVFVVTDSLDLRDTIDHHGLNTRSKKILH